MMLCGRCRWQLSKKHRFHGIVATFNDLIHPESEAIYRFSLENDNLGWSLACWWNTPSRHVFENSSMTRHSWISVESPQTGLDQGVDQTILIGYHH